MKAYSLCVGANICVVLFDLFFFFGWKRKSIIKLKVNTYSTHDFNHAGHVCPGTHQKVEISGYFYFLYKYVSDIRKQGYPVTSQKISCVPCFHLDCGLQLKR